MRGIAVLGATGSIGTSTLRVIADHPDQFYVATLAANTSAATMIRLARRFHPQLVAMADPEAAQEVAQALRTSQIEVVAGSEGIVAAAQHDAVDLVVSAMVGIAGLEGTLAAIEAGRNVVLANKESLVAAGPLVMARAQARGVTVLPADSEHNAIFQCLQGVASPADVHKIWLTASGGPFRGWTPEQLKTVTPAQALQHPNWSMGAKVTVDSATLMNKGLEIIEAMHLFNLDIDRIDVVVHPQSVVHGLVELLDGSMVAHLAEADMRVPIGYCLAYPKRITQPYGRVDLLALGQLTFEPPDRDAMPCLRLAEHAARIGGTMPTVLNAVNEVAVAAFLQGRIAFPDIAAVVEEVMTIHSVQPLQHLEHVYQIDRWARMQGEEWIKRRSG